MCSHDFSHTLHNSKLALLLFKSWHCILFISCTVNYTLSQWSFYLQVNWMLVGLAKIKGIAIPWQWLLELSHLIGIIELWIFSFCAFCLQDWLQNEKSEFYLAQKYLLPWRQRDLLIKPERQSKMRWKGRRVAKEISDVVFNYTRRW